ncbi:MAG: CotH kinase family protein [Bacteroidetes bacterium]|nr:CotH kinase family protein [Bacteroidota bacterium]
MKIKDQINIQKINAGRKRKSRWVFLLLLLLGLILGNTVATRVLKPKGYSSLWNFLTTVATNYYSGLDAQPEKIAIEINSKDFKKLEKNRQNALERRVIINDLDGEYVDGVLHYNGKKIDIKLRLKGHMTDHLQNNKWSFRIKVKEKDETFMGMKRFTIQHPGTRGYIYEWIYHTLMKQEGVIALRYDFINVKVNGEDWGVYAVEENFENELIENNQRIKGPVLRYNPDLYWVNRYNGLTGMYSADEFARYYSADPQAYREEKVLKDSLQKHYYLKAIAMIEGLRANKIAVDEAFDIPRLAKFHAIIDLVGGVHSIDWSDIKYYYNPVTAKLEPVAYESFTVLGSKELSSQYMFVNLDSSQNYSEWHEMIFSNKVFFKEYMKHLERISQPSYLDAFFDMSNVELKKKLAIIHKEFPYKKFDKNDYYKRQKQILHILNPPKALHAYLNRVENNIAELQIAAIDALPVSIISIELDGKQFLPEKEIILPAKQKGKALEYKNYRFGLKRTPSLTVDLLDSLKINYAVLGASKVKQTRVFPYPHTDNEFLKEEQKNKISTVSGFDFLTVVDSTHSIFMKEGKNVLEKDLIIPSGYTCYVSAGTQIDLRNMAKIISYSPFIVMGLEEDQVVFSSSDSSSQGIQFINAGASKFKNVVFKNFARVNDPQWKRSGAITFYESLADFANCSFYDFRSEDALSFIRSDFKITTSLFRGMKDDGLDADFSKGEIKNVAFENCKENGIDATFSTLTLNSVYFSGSDNKAINAKDGSELFLSDVVVKRSTIAISAEDLALVHFKELTISDCDYGLVSYKNKPSAGHAKVEGAVLKFSNVKEHYLQERKSKILVDGKVVDKEIEDVELIIKKGEKKK